MTESRRAGGPGTPSIFPPASRVSSTGSYYRKQERNVLDGKQKSSRFGWKPGWSGGRRRPPPPALGGLAVVCPAPPAPRRGPPTAAHSSPPPRARVLCPAPHAHTGVR